MPSTQVNIWIIFRYFVTGWSPCTCIIMLFSTCTKLIRIEQYFIPRGLIKSMLPSTPVIICILLPVKIVYTGVHCLLPYRCCVRQIHACSTSHVSTQVHRMSATCHVCSMWKLLVDLTVDNKTNKIFVHVIKWRKL